MEILIDDIPEEGLELSASEADSWFHSLVQEVLGGLFEGGDKGSLNVSFARFEDNVNMDGLIKLECHPRCDRCLARFRENERIPFHVVLSPLHDKRCKNEFDDDIEEKNLQDDLEFGFYEGDRFDLSEIVREQILLSLPMKHLCKSDCAGLCQRCGKNLNRGPCGCVEKIGDARFAVLKKVKVKK